MVNGPQLPTMELISMLMNLCAATLMELSSDVMEHLSTSSAEMDIYIDWSEQSACASAYEVAIKLGIISLSSSSLLFPVI